MTVVLLGEGYGYGRGYGGGAERQARHPPCPATSRPSAPLTVPAPAPLAPLIDPPHPHPHPHSPPHARAHARPLCPLVSVTVAASILLLQQQVVAQHLRLGKPPRLTRWGWHGQVPTTHPATAVRMSMGMGMGVALPGRCSRRRRGRC